MTAATFDVDGQTARGVAHIRADHPMFADHFPGHPILPGSTAIELAAQIAGPLAELYVAAHHDLERWAVLYEVSRARFRTPAHLPATVELSARIDDLLFKSTLLPAGKELVAAKLTVAARCGADQTLTARLVMPLIAASDEHADAIRERRQRVDRWIAAWPDVEAELA